MDRHGALLWLQCSGLEFLADPNIKKPTVLSTPDIIYPAGFSLVVSFLSRKLAFASWCPSCFSKVLGAGISNRMKLHSYLTLLPPTSLAGSSLRTAQPPWGHRRHVATCSKISSIRILSMIGVVNSRCFKSLVQRRSLLACSWLALKRSFILILNLHT